MIRDLDGRWPLPQTWRWVRAEEIAEIVGGGTPNVADQTTFAEFGIPWITPADLSGYDDVYISGGRRSLSRKGLESSSARILPRGAVLFSSRAPIGYCVIATNAMATNQGFKSLVLKEGVLPEFVRYYLLGSIDYIDSLARGTTFREISGSKMKKVLIPLAPLDEQHRIISRIGSIFESIEVQRSNLNRAVDLVARYKAAAIDSAFCGELAEASAEPVDFRPIGTLIESLDQGWSPRCINVATEEDDIWAVMTTTAIQPLVFDSKQNKILPSNLAPREHLSVRAGDVLITRAGPRRRVGISCMVEDTKDRLLLCDKAYRLRVRAEVVSPRYLAYMLNASRSLQLIESMKTGISDSGLNLTQSKLLELSVPLCSLAEQDTVVGRLDSAIAAADLLAEQARRGLILLDQLRDATLRNAFKGELSPLPLPMGIAI